MFETAVDHLFYNTKVMKQFLSILALLSVLTTFSAWKEDYPEISDLRNYPQDALAYVSKATSHQRLISALDQSHLEAEYDTKYFGPWHMDASAVSSLEDVTWAFKDFKRQTGYGEDKKIRGPEWIEGIKENANLETYPNKGVRAITIRNTAIRILPTAKPFFYSFALDGEGYPFDNVQHSFMVSNTPIFVSHVSKDGAWSLVESHHGVGWIPTIDLAYVNEAFVNAWENKKYAVVIKDETPIATEAGTFLFDAPIGTLLPVIQETATQYLVMAAVSNESKLARIFRAKLPKSNSTSKPIPLTLYNLGRLANEFIGKPYGWAGMYGNRDCSSFTKDFFAPFGIFLPMNSANQAKFGRSQVDLSEKSNALKLSAIRSRGVPFLTLLAMKGHIMLYIGSYKGEPLVMHSFWGIRTSDSRNPDGRHLVAQTAITTLHAGLELPNRNPEGDFLSRIQSMTFLTDLSS